MVVQSLADDSLVTNTMRRRLQEMLEEMVGHEISCPAISLSLAL